MNKFERSKVLMRGACFALMVCCTAACVTESSGGMPGPAPTDARVQAQLELARGYLEQRDFNRARGPLGKALDIDPQHVEAHVLSAFLLNAEKDYGPAEQHYKIALRIRPDDAQALNNYGTFLYSRGRYADAIEPLERLVKDTTYRARAQAFENLGMAYLRMEQAEQSEAAFARSLELNFRQPRATLELADMAYGRGDHTTAAARLLEFKTMSRQNARSLCLGLKVATALGDDNQASSNLLALKNLFPEAVDACQAKS